VRPDAQDIAVPPFPPGVRWIGAAPPAVERICATGPLLVHFFDAAHHNCVRTLPYLREWQRRYEPHGLTVVGVNSPRFTFTGDAEKLSAALARLAVPFPVAIDADYEMWRDYGCVGWPSLFLWGRGGALRWYHFGEGEYVATEKAVQAELVAVDSRSELPEPLAPVRPSDEPGALVVPPSDEVFPGGSISEPWSGEDSGAPLELGYEAAGAFATADGGGTLEVALDGGAARVLTIDVPGLYELAEHPHHERHRLALRPSAGVRIWSVSFAAGVP
jgi:hypothetical protein